MNSFHTEYNISIPSTPDTFKEKTYVVKVRNFTKDIGETFQDMQSLDHNDSVIEQSPLIALEDVISDHDKALVSYINDNLANNSGISLEDNINVIEGKLYLLDPLSAQYIHLEEGYAESTPQDYDYLSQSENIINDGNHMFLRALHSLVSHLQGISTPYPFEDFISGQLDLNQEETEKYCAQFTTNNQEILNALHIDGLPDFCIPLAINHPEEFIDEDIVYFVNFKGYQKAIAWNNSPNSFRPQFSVL